MRWCIGNGPVAQSGRAPPLQGGGLGFKSRRVHLSAVTKLSFVAKNGGICFVDLVSTAKYLQPFCCQILMRLNVDYPFYFLLERFKKLNLLQAKINCNLIYYVDDLACVTMKGAVSCDNP